MDAGFTALESLSDVLRSIAEVYRVARDIRMISPVVLQLKFKTKGARIGIIYAYILIYFF
jgi:hypothetical protein